MKRGFASDNNSGVSKQVLKMLESVNEFHELGYGEDPFTKKAISLFKENFGTQAEPYFVFTGTAANVLGICAGNNSYNSVICAQTAHINEDECGAPEKFCGCKLISISTPDGKLTPELVQPHLKGFGFEHHSQPGIISITQSSEMGTVYQVKEIKALSQLAKSHNMLLHMDGARLANAAVSLNLPFKSFTTEAGVDILSFGGTKNGLMAAEAIVFLNDSLSKDFKYIRKQGMQLASKMRYMSAQFLAYFENELWKRNAANANAMAQKLYESVIQIPGIKITQKVESNGIFAIIPKETIAPLQSEVFFYPWDEQTGEVRWMCSFDTTEDDINEFISLLKRTLVK